MNTLDLLKQIKSLNRKETEQRDDGDHLAASKTLMSLSDLLKTSAAKKALNQAITKARDEAKNEEHPHAA